MCAYLARTLTFLVLLLALSGTIQAAKLFNRDLLFTGVETELGFWGRGDYHPTEATIERTGRTLGELLSLSPADPQTLILRANYAAWRGYWAQDIQQGQHFNQQAVQAQYAALESRPAHRHSWSKMVEYAARASDGEVMLQQAQARLRALQPNEI